MYVVIFFSDDWAGFDLTWWLLFPWLVEHSWFHSCGGRSGGLCSHVSQINPNMRNNKCNLMFCWWIWNCLAAFFVIHFQMPLMPCDNSMSYVRKAFRHSKFLTHIDVSGCSLFSVVSGKHFCVHWEALWFRMPVCFSFVSLLFFLWIVAHGIWQECDGVKTLWFCAI